MKKTKKWTKEEMEIHINAQKGGYGQAIVTAAMFKHIYGDYPEIGLSGFQANAADAVEAKLP